MSLNRLGVHSARATALQLRAAQQLCICLCLLWFWAGDEAIVPAFTWISTANVVEHLGGKVVFADIDLSTFNIDPAGIESLITPRTKAILPVHLFGLSADMHVINKIAQDNDLWVVEDAACGFGATFQHRHVGTLVIPVASVFIPVRQLPLVRVE